MANRWFTQFYGSLHKKPVQLDCNFVVDSTNQNGYGVRSLKGPGIAFVYMHTTASFVGNTHMTTTIDGISGGTQSLYVGQVISGSGIVAGTTITAIAASGTAITISVATLTSVSSNTISLLAPGSPNPEAGFVQVVFQDNFYRYFFGTTGFVSPVSGTPINISTGSSLTIGNPYVIVSVGTTTTAQWVAVGVPIGITPAVGVTFFASATSGSGTGIVESPGVSGITSVEVVGDPNTTITSKAPTIVGGRGNSGAYLVAQFLGATSSSVTTLIPTAPVNGSVVGMSFFLSNSLIMQQGE